MQRPLSLFPYPKLRPFQDDLMQRIYSADQILCNVPTGAGKSISSLCSFLAQKKKNQKIVVLTRTKSQAKIFLQETAKIADKIMEPILAIHLRSKQEICPLHTDKETTHEEFVQICRMSSDCTYRKMFYDMNPKTLAEEIKSKKLYTNYDELMNRILPYGCPYLILQGISKFSDVIVASYLYLLNPILRGLFLRRIRCKMRDLLLIIDEAHNLQNLDMLGKKLSKKTLDLAAHELSYDFSNVYGLFQGKDQMLDINLDPEEIFFILDKGLEILEKRLIKGKKISYTFRVGSFLHSALKMKNEKNWIFFRKEGSLFLNPVFPDKIVEPLKEAKKLLLMSGTLEPLDGYKVLYGLESAQEFSIPKIFPSENRIYLCLSRGLNTSLKLREERGEELWKEYAQALERISYVSPMTTLVFFPSYDVMKCVLKYTNAICEPKDAKDTEMFWDKVKTKEKKTVFAVCGGKMSEGVEYTVGKDKESVITALVLAGLPFPVPDFELNLKGTLYDRRLGKGKSFLILSVLPMVNKALQAIGRAIRSERDRVAVIILDDRIEYLKYFPELRFEIKTCRLKEIIEEMRRFFNIL